MVSAGTVNTFKARLGKFWSNQEFLYNYMAQPEVVEVLKFLLNNWIIIINIITVI